MARPGQPPLKALPMGSACHTGIEIFPGEQFSQVAVKPPWVGYGLKYFEKLEIRGHIRYYTQNPKLFLRKPKPNPLNLMKTLNPWGTSYPCPR